MVTDDILCAVRSVIDRFETEAEKNAGQAIWNMLSDFSEDDWEEMSDQQKSEWIGKYIPKTKQKSPSARFSDPKKSELIMEHANRPDISICCLGRENTGKSFLLKSLLKELDLQNEIMDKDEINSDEELLEVINGSKKYYTVSGNDIEKLYKKMKSLSDAILTTLVIVLDRTFDDKIYLKGVYEIDSEGIKTIWQDA